MRQYLVDEVRAELQRARAAHPGAFNSAHEGFAVLDEKRDELWQEVKHGSKATRNQRMHDECIQIAAMAFRFLEDVTDKGSREEVKTEDKECTVFGCVEGGEHYHPASGERMFRVGQCGTDVISDPADDAKYVRVIFGIFLSELTMELYTLREGRAEAYDAVVPFGQLDKELMKPERIVPGTAGICYRRLSLTRKSDWGCIELRFPAAEG